jgi:hypothetical protein
VERHSNQSPDDRHHRARSAVLNEVNSHTRKKDNTRNRSPDERTFVRTTNLAMCTRTRSDSETGGTRSDAEIDQSRRQTNLTTCTAVRSNERLSDCQSYERQRWRIVQRPTARTRANKLNDVTNPTIDPTNDSQANRSFHRAYIQAVRRTRNRQNRTSHSTR